MRRFLSRSLPLLALLLGLSFVFVGCQPGEAEQIKAQGDAAAAAGAATGNPWLVLGGTLVSIVSSHFLARGTASKAVAKEQEKQWTADEIDSFLRSAAALGYEVKRAPTVPVTAPPQ